MRRRWLRWAVVVPVALAVLVSAGTWAYIEFVHGDAPDRLTLRDEPAAAPTSGGVDGTWKVSSGSQVGYRVKEVLFGQSTEGVGRTDDISGEIVVDGTSVASGSFTVDMATVTSDENRRDNQFRGRIMDVDRHPTSTFVLDQPIELGSLQQVDTTATGKLTLRGTTKTVDVSLQAERSGDSIRVAGSIPIVFAEWGIPNPSFGPARTEDDGLLEFLLVLTR